MATTGTKLTIPFTVGTGQIVGQGTQPELWVLYSTDDIATAVPSWTTVHQGGGGDVRSFATSRGRDNELQEIDAGTAQIILNNRSRGYDPVANTGIRPLNQWWIREQFTGETQDIFKGYATSYEQQRPDKRVDAITIVTCVDEFGTLSLDALPVTDPPRDTYQDVVAFDGPHSYWHFSFADQAGDQIVANPGSSLLGPFSANGSGTPIVGESQETAGVAVLNGGLRLSTAELAQGDSGDVAGLSEMTVELWVGISALPASTMNVFTGPNAGGATTWRVRIGTTGDLIFEARDSAGTLFTATATGAIIASGGGTATEAHVVATISASNLVVYVNGVQLGGTAWSGTGAFAATIDTGQVLTLGDAGYSGNILVKAIAFYRQGLTTARALAHYAAGAQRGFPSSDAANARIHRVLDSIGSHAPRNISLNSSHQLQGKRMTGQPPLSVMQDAKTAESGDASLFVARDGKITFYYSLAHSGASAQAIFDDDGTDLLYHGSTMDYSDAFLFNYWTVTRAGGLTQTAFDQSSINRYKKRSQGVTDLDLIDDATAATVASALLAKYKDPMQRITSLVTSTSTPGVTEAVFRRDLGDCIQVFGTPPGGGARINQTLFIQRISVSGDPTSPWSITLAVSPL